MTRRYTVWILMSDSRPPSRRDHCKTIQHRPLWRLISIASRKFHISDPPQRENYEKRIFRSPPCGSESSSLPRFMWTLVCSHKQDNSCVAGSGHANGRKYGRCERHGEVSPLSPAPLCSFPSSSSTNSSPPPPVSSLLSILER